MLLKRLLICAFFTLIACRQTTPTPSDAVCPDIYMPVCGSNGQNYNNACQANRAGQGYSQGECNQIGIPGGGIPGGGTGSTCPDIYMPVCGSNGQNYRNACEANRSGQSYSQGECNQIGIPGTAG